MRRPTVGERAPSRRKVPAGYRIERITQSLAYAKSGNAHNPTPRFLWSAYRGDTLIGTRATERGAIGLIDEDAAAAAAPPIIVEVALRRNDGHVQIGDAHVVQGPAAVVALESRSLLDLTITLTCAGYSFTVRPVAVQKGT